jgi:hypothetical protein
VAAAHLEPLVYAGGAPGASSSERGGVPVGWQEEPRMYAGGSPGASAAERGIVPPAPPPAGGASTWVALAALAAAVALAAL